MSLATKYPKTKTMVADVLAAKGAAPISCYIEGGKVVPGLDVGATLNNVADTGEPDFAAYSGNTDTYYLHTGSTIYYSTDGTNYLSYTIYGNDNSLAETITESGKRYSHFIANTVRSFPTNDIDVSAYKNNLSSVVMKSGRIFGIDKTDAKILRWSGENGLNDWEEGLSGAGWIKLTSSGGPARELVVFGDDIAVIRDCGVSLFSAFGNPENFKFKGVNAPVSGYVRRTAAVVGGKLLFYAGDGICAFDGKEIKRLDYKPDGEISSPTYACGQGVWYYLCGQSKTYNRGAVMAVNVSSGEGYLIDTPAKAICAGKAVLTFAANDNKKLENAKSFCFQSGEIDFQKSGVKTLTKVEIIADGNVTLEVSNGVNSRICRGVNGIYMPRMRGKSFKLKIGASGIIYGVKAYAEAIDGV